MYCTFLGWTGIHHRIYYVGSWIDLCNGIGIDNFCFPSRYQGARKITLGPFEWFFTANTAFDLGQRVSGFARYARSTTAYGPLLRFSGRTPLLRQKETFSHIQYHHDHNIQVHDHQIYSIQVHNEHVQLFTTYFLFTISMLITYMFNTIMITFYDIHNYETTHFFTISMLITYIFNVIMI